MIGKKVYYPSLTEFKKKAKKELDKIPSEQFLKIDKAMLSLRKNPYPHPQSKKLKGMNRCRLRIGDYRVVFPGLCY